MAVLCVGAETLRLQFHFVHFVCRRAALTGVSFLVALVRVRTWRKSVQACSARLGSCILIY